MHVLNFPSYLHAVKGNALLPPANVALFFKHGTGNRQFQTEGSIVYQKICCKYVPNAGNSLGYTDELQTKDTKYLDGKNIQVTTTIKKRKLVEEIKNMLNNMKDGSSSVSPYDTAWVALIRDTNGSDRPQFPSCLEWIVDNQLCDGSWGEESVFCIYDRLLNTLASIVALTTWNKALDKRNKGVLFIKENLCKLETGNVENMTCGFEIVFPALLEKAQHLDIDIPYDTPVLKNICERREMKFKRIPMDVVHTIPTTLLFSLEGFRDLDWQKLLKLQMPDGSFLTSIASTAVAFMETNNENCLRFLQRVVHKYNGGAPHSYPVDMQARLWAIDRLQRLGISYYFEEEFKDMLDHVQRYLNPQIGTFSGRNSNFCDIDDTCMAIRLLRLHGYNVNPDVLNKFKVGDNFFCLMSQETDNSPTAMYNLYRCSQVSFPGEKILDDAKKFTYNFLQHCLSNNQSLDKWLIAKDIPGEIRYALEVPWYASLPRVEARTYLQQYGGANDIWIGKTLHRMPDISNDVYLEAAKLDYNICQSQHQFEWTIIQEWFAQGNFQHFGISKKEVLVAYFLGAASIFEVERSRERLAWAKSLITCKMITSYFTHEAPTAPSKNSNETREMVLKNLLQFLHQLSEETYETIGKDIHLQLHSAWASWFMSIGEEKTACQEEAELLVRTINLCGGHMMDDDIISSIDYKNISNITNKVCFKLQCGKVPGINCKDNHNGSSHLNEIESDMKELVKLVLENSSCGINKDMKKTFLAVAKTFYYTAHVTEEVLNFHISKVLFESVE